MMYRILCLCAYLLIQSGTLAQTELSQPFHIQVDRDFYLTGEYVWYKVYVLFPSNDEAQLPLYVDLIGPNDQLLIHHMLPPFPSKSHGEIYLNPDWKEGLYTLVAYQQNAASQEQAIHHQIPIPIYDPDQLSEERSLSDLEEDFQGPQSIIQENYALNITLNVSQSRYSPREKVDVHIKVMQAQGQKGKANLSVSVRPVLQGVNFFSSPGIPIMDQVESVEGSYFGLPDIPLRIQTTSSTVDMPVAVWSKDSLRVVFTEIDAGQINARIKPFYGKQKIQLFPMQGGEEGPELTWNETPYYLSSKISTNTSLPSSEAFNQYLILGRKRQLFQQIFPQSYGVTPLKDAETQRSLISDVSFEASEYIPFENLEAFIRETVYIRYKNKRGKTEIRLLNLDNNLYYKETPLFLVNGYLTRDEEAVMNIPWREITRIELLLSEYRLLPQFAGLGGNGVMVIHTISDRYLSPIIENCTLTEIQGYHTALTYHPPVYTSDSLLSSPYPDFRSIEYWAPHIETDEQGNAEISFFTSDATGVYEIVVEGISADGRTLRGIETYRVTIEE